MKLNYLLALFGLCLSTAAYAQKRVIPTYKPAKHEQGDAIKMPRRAIVSDLKILSLGGNFYEVMPAAKPLLSGGAQTNIYLSLLNAQLRIANGEKRPRAISFEVNGEPAENSHTTVFGGKICAFNSVYDRKADTKILYLQEIDKNNLIPTRSSQSAKQVAQITETKSRSNSGRFDFVMSRDSSKLLIYADMPRKRKDNVTYGLTVLNDKMEILWAKNLDMPYEEGLFDLQDFELDNDGNAYIVAKLYKEKRRDKQNGVPNYAYLILKYNQQGEQVASKMVELQDKYVGQLSIYAGTSEQVRCVGFYSLNVMSAYAGIFYLALDSNLATTKETYKDLSADDIAASDGQNKRVFGNQNRSDLTLGNYIFRNVVNKADGGIQIIAERRWLTTVQNRDSRGRVVGTTTYSNFGSLVIIDLSKAGDINWVSFIKKHEMSSEWDYAKRYALVVTEQGLRFFINDHRKNYDESKKTARVVNWTNFKRQGLISAVLIDHNGKQTREQLVIEKKYKSFSLPYAAYWDGDKELVLPFYQRGALRLDRLQLP